MSTRKLAYKGQEQVKLAAELYVKSRGQCSHAAKDITNRQDCHCMQWYTAQSVSLVVPDRLDILQLFRVDDQWSSSPVCSETWTACVWHTASLHR